MKKKQRHHALKKKAVRILKKGLLVLSGIASRVFQILIEEVFFIAEDISGLYARKIIPFFSEHVSRRFKHQGWNIIARLLLMAIALSGILILTFLFEINNRFDNKAILIKVEYAMPASIIANMLEREGVINNAYGFRVIAKLFHLETHMHAGEYVLRSRMTMYEIIQRLQEKKGLSLTSATSVTIPEGFSLIEIADALFQKNIIASRADFIAYANNAPSAQLAETYTFLKTIPIKNIEGYLYPDTYLLPPTANYTIILDMMFKRFQDKIVNRYESAVKTPTPSLHEVLTLASIIEKEAVKKEEKRTIAGVFYNRLEKHMPLGSCPTVKYAMGKPHAPYLYYKDLDYRSPYNTYRVGGLPPGPIASPGDDSFKAALRPEKTDYYYFVSNGDGTHTFTSNLSDHLKAQQDIMQKAGKNIVY